MADDRTTPERPRVEPEIIPPDRRRGRFDWRQPTWRPDGTSGTQTTHRIFVGRLGPFGFALLTLALAVLVAVIALFVLGAVLIWIPIVALIVVCAAVFGRFRRG